MDEYWNPMVPELSVSDFEKSLAFYTELLGFSVRIRREEPNFAYLEQENVQIMIEQLHEGSWLVDSMFHPFGRGINFQIELTDIGQIYAKLKSSNITFFENVEESWYETGNVLYGQKEFLIQDPDGYLLRFTQHLGEREKDYPAV